MDPYAKPNERHVGGRRPKVLHAPHALDARTKAQRRAYKQAVVDERRAIKKSARQHLKKQMLDDWVS